MRLLFKPISPAHANQSPKFFSLTASSQTQTNKKWAETDGAFKRQSSQFRNSISKDQNAQFPAEANRYHLYVSLACPWAHRTLLGRHLKGLESLISVSVVHWQMGDGGWRFPNADEVTEMESGSASPLEYGSADPFFGAERIADVYHRADPDYNARYTVPVLWDKKTGTIVNNELSEILRMLNTEFNDLILPEHAAVDLYPEQARAQIDELNGWIYDNINNGVYKAGFATVEQVYRKECENLFAYLDKLEGVLRDTHGKKHDFLVGNTLSEADVRLYTTIVRFDPVYHQHFKCNIRMIRHDYPHIHEWVKFLYWKVPGFKETTDFEHIKKHYTKSHPSINPLGITPVGPLPNIMPL